MSERERDDYNYADPGDLRIISDANPREPAELLRAAEYFDRVGMPATAMLFRNAAWTAEHGGNGMDDVTVRE
jgi:hypothetical protein